MLTPEVSRNFGTKKHTKHPVWKIIIENTAVDAHTFTKLTNLEFQPQNVFLKTEKRNSQIAFLKYKIRDF